MSPKELEVKYCLPNRKVNTWVRDGKLSSTTHGEGRAVRYEVDESEFLKFMETPAAGKHQRTHAELLELGNASIRTSAMWKSENSAVCRKARSATIGKKRKPGPSDLELMAKLNPQEKRNPHDTNAQKAQSLESDVHQKMHSS